MSSLWPKSMWNRYQHVLMNVKWLSCMSHASFHVVFSRHVVGLTGKDMNELKYGSILRGYSVWNLCVALVHPMSWSIIAKEGNPDVPPLVSSWWECVVGFFMVWKSDNCMFSETSFKSVLLVPHAYIVLSGIYIIMHMCLWECKWLCDYNTHVC